MCFSAGASFGLSAVLLPAGAYCVRSAWRKDKALLGLAIIPFVFGLQQVCEGLVWRGIDHDNPDLARYAAFFFLYFALAFWPFWVPFCAFLTGEGIGKRRVSATFALLGFAGGLMLYLPILLDPESMTIYVKSHSLFYDITQSAAIRVMPGVLWKALYIVIVGTPMLIAPSRGFVFLGIALVVAATVSHFLYRYAFISVWCFFAAFLSLYICQSFRRLPVKLAIGTA